MSEITAEDVARVASSFARQELEVGARLERERIIKIIERINNHGMTHSEKCLRHHLFAEQALKEINK